MERDGGGRARGEIEAERVDGYRLRAKKGPATPPPPPREFCRHILS